MSELLPPNATDFEKAVSETTARISDLDVSIDHLMAADRCPVDLLPWLAWSLALPIWDNGWPEGRKRSLCGAALKLHQQRGTLAAVKQAAQALDLTADFQEWFQTAGDPHTFTALLRLNDNVTETGPAVISDLSIAQLTELIDWSKRASQHVTIRLRSDHRLEAPVRTTGVPDIQLDVAGTTNLSFDMASHAPIGGVAVPRPIISQRNIMHAQH